jgi:hypothetical protein
MSSSKLRVVVLKVMEKKSIIKLLARPVDLRFCSSLPKKGFSFSKTKTTLPERFFKTSIGFLVLNFFPKTSGDLANKMECKL